MKPSIFINAESRLWTPELVRPALWLDGADPSTITLSTGVSEWRDKSGNGRHFTQSSALLQPAYQSATFNNQNCLRYDGSNDVLIRGPEAWAYQYPIAYFCVFRALSFVPYSQIADFYSSVGGNAAGWATLIKSNNRSAIYMTSTAGQPNYDGTGAISYLTNTPYVFSCNVGNGFIQSWGNGSPDAIFTGTWTARTNIGTANLSVGASAQFSRFTNWDIAEQIVLNSASVGAQSDAVRQTIEGYLAWKWNFPASLPTNHPFKTRPPYVGD